MVICGLCNYCIQRANCWLSELEHLFVFSSFAFPLFSALPNSCNTLTKVAHSDRLFVRM